MQILVFARIVMEIVLLHPQTGKPVVLLLQLAAKRASRDNHDRIKVSIAHNIDVGHAWE
jgi:hypothetical protein